MAEGTMIDMGDGFGGMSLLSGGRLLKGQIKEQDIIDIGAIGLALLLRKIPE